MKRFAHCVMAVGTAAALLTASGAVGAEGSLKVGDKAPEFPHPLPSSAGDKPAEIKLQLSDFVGKKNIVLAFYVADWTSG